MQQMPIASQNSEKSCIFAKNMRAEWAAGTGSGRHSADHRRAEIVSDFLLQEIFFREKILFLTKFHNFARSK